VEVAVSDLLPSRTRDGRRRRFRSHGILVWQSVNSSLVSVAGLIRAPVRDLEAHDVGHLVDVVVRWDRGVYTQVSGLPCVTSPKTSASACSCRCPGRAPLSSAGC